MEFKLCADLLWNAICEFTGVPVVDPTFFQDRGPPRNTSFNPEVLGAPDSHIQAYSNRRQNFRKLTAEAQAVILQGLELKGQTPEAYFGGWTAEQVVDKDAGREASAVRRAAGLPIKADSTPDDTPATRFASRRFEFRKLDAVKQDIYLKRVSASGQTPEAYFGGQSLDKVRNPFSFDKNANAQATANRRSKFRKLSAAKQEALLQNIRDIDETPEAYFGGQSLEKVRSINKFDFGDVGNKTWTSRRLQFRNKTPAKRQVVLQEIEDAGATHEQFFGAGWTIDRVLNAGKK